MLSAFYFFFALMNIASLLGDEELETIDRVVGSLMTLSFFVVGVLIGVLLLVYRRRYNVSFDYAFVEDELRISRSSTASGANFCVRSKRSRCSRSAAARRNPSVVRRRG